MVRGHHGELEEPGLKRSPENSQKTTYGKNADQMGESLDPGTPKYPSGVKLTFIFVALCLTVFLVALVRTCFTSTTFPRKTNE